MNTHLDTDNPMTPEALRKASAVRLGVDLGQKLDPTAIVVVEIQQRPRPGATGSLWDTQCHYVVRALQRLELGTPYPAIVRRLVEITNRLKEDGWTADVWVDATGLGKPVVDLLQEARLFVQPVYMNGSEEFKRGENWEWRLGKCYMVSRLQVLLQTERLHLPATPDAALLVDELLNYEIRINENANTQFGAFRVGVHDDLATALGLACCQDESGCSSAVIPPAASMRLVGDTGGW